MMSKNPRYRYTARITVEAETPVAVGSGAGNIETDAAVVKDINGMPYIPATSIAGVLRHAINGIENVDSFLGCQKGEEGEGSKVVFTDAVMVGKDGKPLDGVQKLDYADNFYACFQNLPIRQHVKMDGNGTAKDGGKFDNEVVYKGTRFVFEMEMVADSQSDGEKFRDFLSLLYAKTFRIGSGTRCGYGKLGIVECKTAWLDLCNAGDLKKYLCKSSDLAKEWGGFSAAQNLNEVSDCSDWTEYVLTLTPVDFFMFGSGLGDEQADAIPVSEKVITWKDGKPEFSQEQILIPATSVKGALAHRTAYHYNKIKGFYADDDRAKTGDENPAVAAVFGVSGNGKDSSEMKRGNIIVSDVMKGNINAENKQKVLYHVKIDYFTGGTVDGALFQEKSVYGKGDEYKTELLVKNSAIEDNDVREAFEQSLKDICTGLLPLGGTVNRGNGMFTGSCTKNGESLWK